tara:strand:+ start:497 stop:1099 length:603 start_codon:yes stop_codon:yes gene_type:complete
MEEQVKLTVVRTQFGKDATNGMLFIDGVFECFTLEDQYQEVKVMHETCIDDGEYKIKFKKWGGFHDKYKVRYGGDHYGMLHVQNVPNFSDILIHTGNTDEHTSGCLLLGETQQDLDMGKDGFIGSSKNAYLKAYKKIAKELLIGTEVIIEYTTINKLFEKPLEVSSSQDIGVAKEVMEKLEEINGGVIQTQAMLRGRIVR